MRNLKSPCIEYLVFSLRIYVLYCWSSRCSEKENILLMCPLNYGKGFFSDDVVKTIIYHMTLRIALSDLVYAPDQLIVSYYLRLFPKPVFWPADLLSLLSIFPFVFPICLFSAGFFPATISISFQGSSFLRVISPLYFLIPRFTHCVYFYAMSWLSVVEKCRYRYRHVIVYSVERR